MAVWVRVPLEVRATGTCFPPGSFREFNHERIKPLNKTVMK